MTAGLARVDPYDVLVRQHLAFDVKMNRENDYTPAASVLRAREFHRQADEVLKLGQAVRPDFWQEWDGKDRLQVGFRDNRDKATYTTAVKKLGDLLDSAGYVLKVSSGFQKVMLNKVLADKIEGRHSDYLSAMVRAGAKSGRP